MDSEGIDYAVVLDDRGGLHGYLGRRRADGEGLVADRTVRMSAWVPASAQLKTAFSTMLLHDAGWVAVLDDDTQRYLGVLSPDSLHAALRRSMGDAE
jgi:osmoprotectant transport system ATP-binding protein